MGEQEVKETYGDPIKLRLGGEFWRIVDDLMPNVLAALEYVTENRSIDDEWRQTITDLGVYSLELKYSILGFKSMLTKEDADSIRTYDDCLKLVIEREERALIQRGQMEGRAELFARQRLRLEDRVLALYYQVLDIRAVAFKNKIWDVSNRPQPRKHAQ